MVKAGDYGAQRIQRWKCQQRKKRFSDPVEHSFNSDVRLPKEKAAMILNCLVEGNSVRAKSRLCDVEKRTVLPLSSEGDCEHPTWQCRFGLLERSIRIPISVGRETRNRASVPYN